MFRCWIEDHYSWSAESNLCQKKMELWSNSFVKQLSVYVSQHNYLNKLGKVREACWSTCASPIILEIDHVPCSVTHGCCCIGPPPLTLEIRNVSEGTERCLIREKGTCFPHIDNNYDDSIILFINKWLLIFYLIAYIYRQLDLNLNSAT